MDKKKSGIGIVQVLIATTLLGFLSLGIFEVMGQMNIGTLRTREASVISELRNQSTPIMKDHERWLAQMRTSFSALASCIPPTGAAFSCPAATAGTIDPDVVALYSGKTITSQALVDILGNPLAGDDATPLLLKADGTSPCTSNCAFEARGFFVRQNATLNPGDISFVYKITKLASNSTATPMKPILVKIDLGMAWQNPAIGSMAITCNLPNTYLKGISATGVPNCPPFPTFPVAPVIPSCNPVTEYLGSNSLGQTVCKRFVYANCADDEHITTNASGNLVCKKDQSACPVKDVWNCSCRRTINGGIEGYVVFCVHCNSNKVINEVWAGPFEVRASSIGSCPAKATIDPPGSDSIDDYNISSD